MLTKALIATIPLVALVAGCGGSGGSGTNGDTGMTGSPVAESVCSQETRATPYSAGMSETTASGLVVAIEDADPAPPREGNAGPKYNVWTMSVKDAKGDLVPTATLKIVPHMPDHGHDSPVTTRVSANGDGTFAVSDVDFNMQGFWQVEVTVTNAGTSEQVIFPLCVA